ncbi:hypothetical protein [Zooshikella harenae]|uniref:Uncharacterized protein n=1 Tax=Zooshikella harenae TaxID=2827238 RepID=A0ABS5Z9I8_9GAMM|nr:hypothetical protein [Zooshikella harenae]MBU2710418.1 hypothetical protein [Zooshikella harenae]
MNKLIIRSIILLICSYSMCSVSAPISLPGRLPLSGEDLDIASDQYSGAVLQQFQEFILGLTVFPDHANPTSTDVLNNLSTDKTYYLLPYYQPTDKYPVAGVQEVAGNALKVIASLQDLVTSADVALVYYEQITKERLSLQSLRQHITSQITRAQQEGNHTAVVYLKQVDQDLAEQDLALANKLVELKVKGEQGLSELTGTLRKELVKEIVKSMATLGYQVSANERAMLFSDNIKQQVEGILTVTAKAVHRMDFGVRQGLLLSGYTEQEMAFLDYYYQLRPDIRLVDIQPQQLHVSMAGVSVNQPNTDNPIVDNNAIVSAPRLYKGVNLQQNGVCGKYKQCNVMIDFTYVGAMMANTAKWGVMALPIVLTADVKVKPPMLEGTMHCQLDKQWFNHGRTASRDQHAIYYDDAYSGLFNSTQKPCRWNVRQGEQDATRFYTTQAFMKYYQQQGVQRVLKSNSEQQLYGDYIQQELDYWQARESSIVDWRWKNFLSWKDFYTEEWRTYVKNIIQKQRSNFWQLAIDINDSIKFEEIVEAGESEVHQFILDAMPNFCWKSSMRQTQFLSACPKQGDYRAKADHDVGKSVKLCEGNPFSLSCLDIIERTNRQLETDDQGVIREPVTSFMFWES